LASIATSNITQVVDASSPLGLGPFSVEVWRIAAGAASADTAVITPKRGRNIVGILGGGPFSHNLGTTVNTNVTLTLSSGTATVGAFDVTLLIAQP